ncbi:hypothetical protein AK812_SmicGene13896 [Symbiodinium microadriaticum]|uniref:Uncharacterized protein n=1 Tax=Symbiodinium microadriaticum TaxID=2951 RepID=A0A1Q9E6X6_SYMMI|nr:hypothetical protein AK812_SmicGene13896 [Symbiodinium microadriaticum]
MLIAVRSDQWSLRLRPHGRKRAFSLTCFVQVGTVKVHLKSHSHPWRFPIARQAMPQVVHRSEEEDIPPLSLSGVWRSVAVQLEVYKERPAPSCAFSLALLTWVAALYRILRTDFPPPGPAGLCMDPAAVRFAQGFEAKRWLLHALWPLEPGYLRGFLSSSLLLVLGYSLEYELGSVHFCGLLLGLQIGAAFLLLHFRFSMCVISLEPAMAGLAVIAHRVNPKVHSDGLGAALKLPFEVEPRWHIWVLLGLLLMQAGDFPNALVVHAAGLLLGAVVVLREPEVWGDAWHALVGRSFTCGAVAHIVLFVFTIVFMPLTVPEAPPDMLALFQAALADGRLFKLSWWRDSIPSSLPLLHMAISGQLGGEALYICRFLLSIALPLLLSSMRLWTRLYSVFFVILLMYTMNSPTWRYPHCGFFSLFYLVVAMWKLPN